MILWQILFIFPYIACFNVTNKEALKAFSSYFKMYPVVMLLIAMISAVLLLGVAIFVPFLLMFAAGFIAFINSRFYIAMFKRGTKEKAEYKIKLSDK